MKNPLRSDASTGMGLLLARIPVGAVLALAGFMKLRSDGGIDRFVADHLSQVPAYMPAWFGSTYLHVVPFAEISFGVLLMAGLLTRVSGFLAGLMLVSFGMTGGFLNPHPADASQLFKAPTLFAALAFVAFFAGSGRISVDHLLFGRGRKA